MVEQEFYDFLETGADEESTDGKNKSEHTRQHVEICFLKKEDNSIKEAEA